METVKGINPKTKEDLRKFPVKVLRKYISTNKIFKGGLSTLSKKHLIEDILVSDFWKKVGDKEPLKKEVKSDLTTTLNTIVVTEPIFLDYNENSDTLLVTSDNNTIYEYAGEAFNLVWTSTNVFSNLSRTG